MYKRQEFLERRKNGRKGDVKGIHPITMINLGAPRRLPPASLRCRQEQRRRKRGLPGDENLLNRYNKQPGLNKTPVQKGELAVTRWETGKKGGRIVRRGEGGGRNSSNYDDEYRCRRSGILILGHADGMARERGKERGAVAPYLPPPRSVSSPSASRRESERPWA